jgi:hypothetical protein
MTRYCEDYPACGHTPQDPCDPRSAGIPSSEDIKADPARYHLGCDHNTGHCDYEEREDDE